MKNPEILIIPILATCLIVIILNGLYRQALYDKGIEIIISMQQSSNFIIDWFFLLISLVIDPTVVVGLCILIVVLSKRKKKSFTMLIFILLNTFCAALLKAYDSDPRPIWTNSEIRSISLYCPLEYGNPSGHSWFAAIFGFAILMDYWGSGKNYMNIWISFGAVIFMPLSRMYLGAHSLNQVLEGLLLGLAMCLMYVLGLKSLIHVYLMEFNRNLMCKLFITACHILYLIAYFIHRNEELPAEWEKNITDKCNVVMNEDKLNLLMLAVNGALVSAAMGVGMGYERLEKSKLGENYLEGKWTINEQKYELRTGYIIFFIIECICLLSGLFLGLLVAYFIGHTVIGFIIICIGSLISGYVYTSKTCSILGKYKIIVETE